MKDKSLRLLKKQLQNFPKIKSQKDLGYILLQYCQAILDFYNIDRCGILLPNSNVFIDSIFVRASKENGTINNNIFIPTLCMPWKWQSTEQCTASNKGIIILPTIPLYHPYKYSIENLFKCLVRALVIIPLCLNDEVIGYLIFVNEKTPRIFTSKEISLMGEIAGYAMTFIKIAIKMGEEEQRDRLIETINDYKQSVATGRKKDPEIIVNFLRIVYFHIFRVMLINKNPQKGTKWYHAEVNDAFRVEKVETGTLPENTFDFFIHEININEPEFLNVPIIINNNIVGKLTLKYFQLDYHRAMRENYFRLLLAIAPYLAELMYL